jgi:alpha-tubulin suppressor-like RCC1 family protein
MRHRPTAPRLLLGLGRLPMEAVRIPTATAGLVEMTQLTAGGSFTCGLDTQSIVYCWGSDEFGQLGVGGASDPCGATRCVMQPMPIPEMVFDTVVAGGSHACALRAGAAYCWGYGVSGRLGDGNSVHRNTPTPVQGNLEFTRIAAGGAHTCAIARDGNGYCWGNSANGQIGDGIAGSTLRALPTRIVGGDRLVAIVTGTAHSCGLTVDGRALCWGANPDGRVGNGGSGSDVYSPVQVSGNVRFATLSAGPEHTCGLDATGNAYCWGSNEGWQLGDETTLSRTVPTLAAGGIRFRSLATGYYRTCGIGTDGFAYCWGLNYQGGLGTGSETLGVGSPARVASPQ